MPGTTDPTVGAALVQNVLSAIGAAPHLSRPNLPAPTHHYPAGVNLTLVPALEGAEGVDACTRRCP